ncbi:hypothetical protein LguiA_012276 [Lonicera macranthoides]
MARQMVVLALVFVAFVGMVSAADTAKAPTAAAPQSGPTSADPMSPPSPTSESAAAGPTATGAPAPGKSSATTLKVSSLVGVAAAAVFFFY